MNNFEKLLNLANKMASAILRGEKPVEHEGLLSEKDQEDVFNELSDADKRKERQQLMSEFEQVRKDQWKIIKSKTQADRSFSYKRWVVNVAAVFVMGIVSISYLQYKNDIFNLSDDQLKIVDQKIKIELSDGQKKVINPNGELEISVDKNVVGVQKGGVLDYSKGSQRNTNKRASTKENKKTPVYHSIEVPLGKTFVVILSDGTKVHLNSGTTFRYPLEFINGLNRQVYLTGEAFFEVTEDENHSFIVNTGELDIKVYGTKFNVSSYSDDDEVNTVLVSGSVSLTHANSTDSQEILLDPGYCAGWDKQAKTLELKEVDTDLYTSWIEGKIKFRKEKFKTIRKKLERHYNVTIINNNKELDEMKYNAFFETETIDDVLASFQTNFDIQYEIKDNQIVIN